MYRSKQNRVALVMAGGSGERFWPVSTPSTPKQLLNLTNPRKNMLEEAVARIAPLVGEENVYISTSRSLAEPICDSGTVDAERVFAEPTKRNTFGALFWAMVRLASTGKEDSTVAVVTSDHRIGQPECFRGVVETAMAVAESEGGLVTIGVKPTRPETGFGYIQAALHAPKSMSEEQAYYSIERFREKPSASTAEAFCQDPRFFWNSGMFFFTVTAFKEALQQCQPLSAQLFDEIVACLEDGQLRKATQLFEELPNISFDYAVMEHAPKVHMVEAQFSWDDVGSWDALERSMLKDENGNVQQGPSTMIESNNCVVVNHDPKTKIGILGISDLIVVHTSDALLICPKSHAQRVKEVPTAIYTSRASAL